MADPKVIPVGSASSNPILTTLRDAYLSLSERRDALGLSNPGTVENIDREVKKNVFLTNYTFSGLRADWTRPFSMTPLFQVAHAFSIGSQGLPPYNFTAMYGTDKVCGLRSSTRLATANYSYRFSCKETLIMMDSYRRGPIISGIAGWSRKRTHK